MTGLLAVSILRASVFWLEWNGRWTWWRHQMETFSAYRSLVNSPHKIQWRGALMFSLVSAWINGWVNNLEVGDLRRHRAHYGVTVLLICDLYWEPDMRWCLSIKKLENWEFWCCFFLLIKGLQFNVSNVLRICYSIFKKFARVKFFLAIVIEVLSSSKIFKKCRIAYCRKDNSSIALSATCIWSFGTAYFARGGKVWEITVTNTIGYKVTCKTIFSNWIT